MSRKFLTSLDMGQNQFIRPVMENLAGAPSSPVKGQFYMNSTDNVMYWFDGAVWVAAKATADVPLGNAPSSLVPGNAVSGGVSTDAARVDHVHGLPGFGSIIPETAFGGSKADGSAGTFARSDHAHGTPVHDTTAHTAIPLSALAVPTTDVSFNNRKLTSLGSPTAGTDAVTKDYADNLAAGLSWKDAVRLATTANTTQSGLAAIDGVTPVINDRILCKDQTTGSQNGIWLAQAGAWLRATDADSSGELDGATVFVMEGTVNADRAYTCTTNAPIAPGTTATTWVQFGAGTSYSAGNALVLTGSTFDVVAADASIVVAADTIRAGYAGNGTAVTLARSDHNHDTTYSKVLAQDCAASVLTTVTHNFNTRDVVVEVYRASNPWDSVDCDIERPSVNSVDVRFAVAPTLGAYRIIVQGLDL